MGKEQKSYKFDTSGVKEMQRFSTFTDLFKAVTGREPPSGGRNLTIATNNLKRYLSYDKAINLDSNEKSKRAVVITKIYNPPLKAEENRGKHGTYIDDMKCLILGQSEFNGKNYVLWNTLGLFARYFDYVKASPEIQRQLEDRTNEFDYNLWQSNSKMQPSEREYRMLVSNQLKQITENTLNSLQKDGIIEWEQHYMWIPHILTTAQDCEPRIKSFKELQDESKKRCRALNHVASQVNSVLIPSIVSALFIGARKEDRSQYETLKKQLVIDNHLEPIPTTSGQTAAIENYQLYIRQCAYAEYRELEELPLKKNIPNKGEIFAIADLKKKYLSLDESNRKTLLGEIAFWQEIKYRVVDKQKLEKYFLRKKSAFDKQFAEKLTVNILKYMDKQMANHQCGITTESRIIGWGKIITGTNLGKYTFAYKLHKELKKLYDIHEETAQLALRPLKYSGQYQDIRAEAFTRL